METLERWIDRQYRYSAGAMLASVSPVTLVKSRQGFGQVVRAKKGAIVASPVLAAYDPDPDYFFHWYRDSAVVVEALLLLYQDGVVGEETLATLADFVSFSRSLQQLDGRKLAATSSWRQAVVPDFVQYLRSEAELAEVHGEAVAADTRINPDATLDISKWARPQFDGPSLRALALLRWLRAVKLDPAVVKEAADLIRADLAFAATHWRTPSFDIWEEELGRHYYTLCVAAAAFEEGAAWLEASGDALAAHRYRTESGEIWRSLDGFWVPAERYLRSRVLSSGVASRKELDIAVILAAIHSQRSGTQHSVHDPRLHATLARLEALFSASYPINHNRDARRGPALGRYANDVYYSGGAYYFSTLGAAEFCFRAASGGSGPHAWIERGDAYLETVRAFTPAGGELSEQFDKSTGAQTSARHLAWSYAAFISCVTARRAVVSAEHDA
jgi:glucoamylase